ncbi:MAG TPA: glucoamylase family protein [Cellulomonas sp.]|nr:glucoamylase family protein [Cellulomonas sp.]
MRLRTVLAAAATTCLLIALAGPAVAGASGGQHPTPGTGSLTRADRADLQRWATDTWASFAAMTDESTGLPADNIDADLSAASRSGYTSPTNIGAYLWSTVVAEKLGIIGHRETRTRLTRTLTTLSTMERHAPSGMFYNWYDEATGNKLTVFPDGEHVDPFLSSVDNGWFAAALMVVRNAEPAVRKQADALLAGMDFGAFYDANQFGGTRPGMVRGGFWVDPPSQNACPGTLPDGTPVQFTCNHYDILDSEPRIVTYIGISRGQIPPEAYFATYRTFPASCDWSWPEQRPVGETRSYLGLDVFEGAFTYRGMHIVPTWGGTMFEELMPDLFVPESSWGTKSWAVNHPLAVRAQIEHGLDDAGYGYWGFSPASNPFGGYSVYGVDEIGMDPGGYPSDREGTNVDKGYDGCRDATNPTPTFGDGVVTPHASFLALPYAPRATVDNLRGIEDTLGAYGAGGFYDSVATRSGTAAKRYLSLDQGIIMGSLGNVLGENLLHDAFSKGAVERTVKPLLALEQFGSGLVAETTP